MAGRFAGVSPPASGGGSSGRGRPTPQSNPLLCRFWPGARVRAGGPRKGPHPLEPWPWGKRGKRIEGLRVGRSAPSLTSIHTMMRTCRGSRTRRRSTINHTWGWGRESGVPGGAKPRPKTPAPPRPKVPVEGARPRGGSDPPRFNFETYLLTYPRFSQPLSRTCRWRLSTQHLAWQVFS